MYGFVAANAPNKALEMSAGQPKKLETPLPQPSLLGHVTSHSYSALPQPICLALLSTQV